MAKEDDEEAAAAAAEIAETLDAPVEDDEIEPPIGRPRCNTDITVAVHRAAMGAIYLRDALMTSGRSDVAAHLDNEHVRATFLDQVTMAVQSSLRLGTHQGVARALELHDFYSSVSAVVDAALERGLVDLVDQGQWRHGRRVAGIDLTVLDPGIRAAVAFMRHHGYETTDSGDGRTKPIDERVLDVPHVFARVEPSDMLGETVRLARLLKGKCGLKVAPLRPDRRTPLADEVSIEASFCPAGGTAIISVMGRGLLDIQGQRSPAAEPRIQ